MSLRCCADCLERQFRHATRPLQAGVTAQGYSPLLERWQGLALLCGALAGLPAPCRPGQGCRASPEPAPLWVGTCPASAVPVDDGSPACLAPRAATRRYELPGATDAAVRATSSRCRPSERMSAQVATARGCPAFCSDAQRLPRCTALVEASSVLATTWQHAVDPRTCKQECHARDPQQPKHQPTASSTGSAPVRVQQWLATWLLAGCCGTDDNVQPGVVRNLVRAHKNWLLHGVCLAQGLRSKGLFWRANHAQPQSRGSGPDVGRPAVGDAHVQAYAYICRSRRVAGLCY